MAASDTLAKPAHHELFITRIFDAPRALVFRVWTAPEHLMRWWGPRDFEVLSFKMDFRVGGHYRAGMRSPGGLDYWMQGTYREIVPPERLAFTFKWDDAHGQPTLDTLVTVTFTEQDGKTKLSFHHAPFDSIEQRDSHHGGWSECLDRLAAYLATA